MTDEEDATERARRARRAGEDAEKVRLRERGIARIADDLDGLTRWNEAVLLDAGVDVGGFEVARRRALGALEDEGQRLSSARRALEARAEGLSETGDEGTGRHDDDLQG